MKRTVALGVLILAAVFALRAAGQVESRRRAEEEQRRAFEAQRQAEEAAEQQAREAAKLEDAHLSFQAKRDEIAKALSDLAVLRAKSAELERTIRKLQDDLAREEAALRDRQAKARERARAGDVPSGYEAIPVRPKFDQGRGVEEKLDAILKWLDLIERRLSDLEGRRQPGKEKK